MPMNFSFDWDEVTTLITMLQARGIRYLIGSDPAADQELAERNPVQFIQRLAACGYPLVENASIALFILHPELAPAVEEALQQSDAEIAENIAVLVLATLYLQHWWVFRLTFALGHLPSFPEAPFISLWEDRHLPPPGARYGMDGLLALQEYEQRRCGIPLNFLDDWQNQINHLLAQEEAYHRVLPEEVRKALVALSRVDKEVTA